MDSVGSGYGSMVGSCERGEEPSGSAATELVIICNNWVRYWLPETSHAELFLLVVIYPTSLPHNPGKSTYTRNAVDHL